MALLVIARDAAFSIRLASGSAIQFAHRSVASSTVMVRRIYLPQSSQTLRLGTFGWGVGMGPSGVWLRPHCPAPQCPALLIEFPGCSNPPHFPGECGRRATGRTRTRCYVRDRNAQLCFKVDCSGGYFESEIS